MARVVGEELYPIRTVASLTGVSTVTLRAWERRYGLVHPRRTPGGHRLYTRDDVERIQDVVALLEKGTPVGRAADLLSAPGEPAAPREDAPQAAPPPRDLGYIASLLSAVERFDEARVDALYNEALALYPFDQVVERVLMPVLGELGMRWSRRDGGIAEEHFFTSFVRTKLTARLHHLARAARGPRLLAACLGDDRHDLGLLMFGYRATLRGYRMVLLGASLPVSQLTPAVRGSHADALVLSMSLEPPPHVLERDLAALVTETGIPVALGGALAEVHRDAIEAAGAHCLGVAFDPALDHLDALLGRAGGARP